MLKLANKIYDILAGEGNCLENDRHEFTTAFVEDSPRIPVRGDFGPCAYYSNWLISRDRRYLDRGGYDRRIRWANESLSRLKKEFECLIQPEPLIEVSDMLTLTKQGGYNTKQFLKKTKKKLKPYLRPTVLNVKGLELT